MKLHGCGVVGCVSKDSIHHNVAFGGPPFDPSAGQARIVTDSKWLDFTLARDTGKTFIWQVRTKEGLSLGVISWFGRWRTYAFTPSRGTVFEPTCLRDISVFIDARMADRRAK